MQLGRRTVRLLRFRRLCSKTFSTRVDDFERVTTTLSAHDGVDVEGQCVSRTKCLRLRVARSSTGISQSSRKQLNGIPFCSQTLPRYFRLQVKSVEGESCEDVNEFIRCEAKVSRAFDLADALDDLNESLRSGDLAWGDDGVQSSSRVPSQSPLNTRVQDPKTRPLGGAHCLRGT